MEKVYRLLDWVDMAQAVDWLQDMTETPVTEYQLFQLCEAGKCAVYARIEDVSGASKGLRNGAAGKFPVTSRDDKKGLVLLDEVEPRGIQQVLNATELKKAGTSTYVELEMIGEVITIKHSHTGTHHTACLAQWRATVGMRDCLITFKASDIQSLAEKMNMTAEQYLNSTELEFLRKELEAAKDRVLANHRTIREMEHEAVNLCQQLEQERTAREAAEADAAELRAQRGKSTLSDIRLMLKDDSDHKTLLDRAEQAERMVAALDRQLAEQAECQRLNDKAFKEMAKQLREHHAGQQPDAKPEAPTTGLTFPYATKELEAMRAAVAKYWEGYTTDKRQPTQKEVAIEIGELLGLSLMKNKDPARKAVNLAAAIKPNDLPDA